MVVGILAAIATPACADKARVDKASPIGPSPSTTASAEQTRSASDSAQNERLYVNPARRCSECHGRIEDQWSGSAHARSTSSPVYRAMRPRATGAACDHCHAPLAEYVEPSHPAAAEGVTCDACHTIRDVVVRAGSSETVRGLDDNTRYGTLSDAKNHYFHRMGYLPMYGEAEYCAGCHHGAHAVEGAAVFSEYDEWRAGPYARKRVPCQRCHMPGDEAEVATGAGVRGRVPHHGWLGADGDLRRRALHTTAVVRHEGDTVTVDVSIENVRAGHPVPTGFPERRIVLEAEVVDGSGNVISSAEKAYGRHLVDGSGRPAPFLSAQREALDDRILPKQTKTEHFVLSAARAGALVLRVSWHAVDAQLAKALAIAPVPFELLGEARVEVGPGSIGQVQHVEVFR